MVIVGIDEVGRGCLAGPVAAAAVILQCDLMGLRDSKMLSKEQREQWALNISGGCAVSAGIGWTSSQELDEVGLTQAVRLAMQRAINQITLAYDQVIIDGNYNFLADDPKAVTIIKADQTVPAVGAASIIAKVARDKYMTELATCYPEYGFEKHVGYGTKFHRQMIRDFGPSNVHRRSFRMSV